MLQINVGGELFTTKKDTLNKCAYFAGLLELSGDAHEVFYLDRDGAGFRYVLSYLRDDKRPFPLAYSHELDFYGVPYPKYSEERECDYVNVYVSGQQFRVL